MRGRGILLALALALGCKSKPAPPPPPPPASLVVTRLSVVDKTPAAQRPAMLPAAAVEQALRAAITAAGYTFADEATGDAWRVRIDAQVRYGLTDGAGLLAEVQAAPAKAHWGVEVELKPPDRLEASHAWLEGEAEAPFTPGAQPLEAVLTAQVTAALAPIQAGLTARRESVQLSEAELIDRVSAEAEATRWAAVDRLAELKATGAVPSLALRAGVEPVREIRLRIVGALAEIGDARAAEGLIGLADPRDREILRAVVDALSVVGGERVEDFLDILGSHDAADVRQMVAQARARMARRARPRPGEDPGPAPQNIDSEPPEGIP